MPLRHLVGPSSRRQVAPVRWCSRLVAPASIAVVLVLIVHLLSALRSSRWVGSVVLGAECNGP